MSSGHKLYESCLRFVGRGLRRPGAARREPGSRVLSSASAADADAEELREYGAAYHGRISPFGTYKSAADAVKYGAQWYAGWLRYVDEHMTRLDGTARRALDVGCGMGALLPLLRERGYEGYGMDRSTYVLARVRTFVPAPLIAADISSGIPFNATFDLITCLEVLEHLPEPGRALRHIFGALGSGGVLVASTPFPGRRASEDPTHINLKTADQWLTLMREAGFGEVMARPIWCPPWLWRLGRVFSRAFPAREQHSTTVLFVARKR